FRLPEAGKVSFGRSSAPFGIVVLSSLTQKYSRVIRKQRTMTRLARSTDAASTDHSERPRPIEPTEPTASPARLKASSSNDGGSSLNVLKRSVYGANSPRVQ